MITRLFRTSIVPTILALMPTLFAGFAAAQSVNYRLDLVPLPAGADSCEVIGMNSLGVVVGRFGGPIAGAGFSVGYVYDHPGMLGVPKALYLLPALIDVPGEWTSTGCWGINDQGQVVGYMNKIVGGTEQRAGFVMDLATSPPVWKYLPTPAGSSHAFGLRINEYGDVVGVFNLGGDAIFGYFCNVANDSTQYEILSDPSTGLPLSFNASSPGLNNLGQVSGKTANGWFRLTPGVTLESIQNANLGTVEAINDWGVLCGRASVVTGTTKGGRTTFTQMGCFYDTQITSVSGTFMAKDINNSNDVAMAFSPEARPRFYRGNEGLMSIDPMLSPNTSTADMNYWKAGYVPAYRLTERDGVTNYPKIAGWLTRTTTTGSGKNKVTMYDRRIFVLTPEFAP